MAAIARRPRTDNPSWTPRGLCSWEPVWLRGTETDTERAGEQRDLGSNPLSALLSLQKLWSADTVLRLCRAQFSVIYLFSIIDKVCIMRLLVYDMLVNVNGIYCVHVCEKAC